MKKLILIFTILSIFISCHNVSQGPSIEDRIARDLAEIQAEANDLLNNESAAKDMILDLINRINTFIDDNLKYLEQQGAVTLLNDIVDLLQTFADNLTYNDQLASFIDLLGNDIVLPLEPTPAELYAISIQVNTYAGIYGITLEDAETALNDYGVLYTSTIMGLINGTITLSDLMIAEDGMYTDEDEGIVVGLPLEEDIPEDSVIEVHGTPTIVDDGTRTGMEFNSSDDYLIIPADPLNDLTNAGTIDLWIKPYSIPLWGGIIHKGSEDDWSDESYSLQYAFGDAITLALHPVSDPANWILIRGTTDMNTMIDQWVHIVVTWNEDEGYIYINGVDDTSSITYGYSSDPVIFSDYSPFNSSTGDVVVGKQVPGDTYQFDGVISNVIIYNTYTE